MAQGPHQKGMQVWSNMVFFFFFLEQKFGRTLKQRESQVNVIVDETTPDRELAAKISMG